VIRFIAALDSRRGIANDSGIPWQGQLPSDVAYFRRTTEGGVVVMGYATYTELASPLPDRRNVVATSRSGSLRPGFESVGDARTFLESAPGDLWVMGGAGLFANTLDLAGELYLTQLERDFDCTKFFPVFDDRFHQVSASESLTENGITFRFEIWGRDAGAPPGTG
jgi:dihydrofolate reductase